MEYGIRTFSSVTWSRLSSRINKYEHAILVRDTLCQRVHSLTNQYNDIQSNAKLFHSFLLSFLNLIVLFLSWFHHSFPIVRSITFHSMFRFFSFSPVFVIIFGLLLFIFGSKCFFSLFLKYEVKWVRYAVIQVCYCCKIFPRQNGDRVLIVHKFAHWLKIIGLTIHILFLLFFISFSTVYVSMHFIRIRSTVDSQVEK